MGSRRRQLFATQGSAAQAMLSWLGDRLARQRATAGRVWLVHHILWGSDPYSTINARASTCPAKVVPFLREPFASDFLALLVEYHDVRRSLALGLFWLGHRPRL
jgi:sphingomyelin phosphodiesterase acid-like 3